MLNTNQRWDKKDTTSGDADECKEADDGDHVGQVVVGAPAIRQRNLEAGERHLSPRFGSLRPEHARVGGRLKDEDKRVQEIRNGWLDVRWVVRRRRMALGIAVWGVMRVS